MIKSYFSKRDRQAIVALTLTLLAGCGFLWVLGEYGKKQENSEIVEKKDKEGRPPYYASEQNSEELFCFDPNTADSTALLKLGLRPWQVRNIYKYRAHGGIYRNQRILHGFTVFLPINISDSYPISALPRNTG